MSELNFIKKLKEDDEVFSNYDEDFVNFLMDKNNLNKEEAVKLFALGLNSFKGGFSGSDYGNFTEFFSQTFSWKYGNSEDVYHETYKFHGPLDFFRMLSYQSYTSQRDMELYKQISDFLKDKNESITLVDYGAGLAHITLTLAKILKFVNVKVKLVIIDIDRFIFKEFLKFISKRYECEVEFIDINSDNPYPKIPKFDFLQIKDVFEHVHSPEKIVDNIINSAKENSIISATTDDEGPEMMHVTRDLKHVRNKFKENNFQSTGKSFFLRGEVYMKSDEKENTF